MKLCGGVSFLPFVRGNSYSLAIFPPGIVIPSGARNLAVEVVITLGKIV